MKRRLVLTLALLLCSCSQVPAKIPAPPADAEPFPQFAKELEALQQRLRIPGLSAAIVKDQQLVWARGFGYADLEKQIPASPETPYHLASLTKPFAAVILMQLVEEGKLDLDDPVSMYGIELNSPGVIRVRHLLTHTSEGTPGLRYNYNGGRYALLSRVIESASGKPFEELLRERISEPLGMTRTAPNIDPQWDWGDFGAAIGLGEYRNNYAQVYRDLAQPYQLDGAYQVVPGSYPTHFSTAAGLLSTVGDIAKFDIALDQDRLLQPETKAEMFAPARSEMGSEFPYGLGWFTQEYRGTRLIWHYGHWTCNSSLIVKVPERNITLIVLANSDNLSRPYPLGDGDLLDSTVALVFLRTFVFPSPDGQPLPVVDWEAGEETLAGQLEQIADADLRDLYARELWSYRRVYRSVGRAEDASRVQRVYDRVFPRAAYTRNASLPGLAPLVPAAGIPVLAPAAAWLWLIWLLLAGCSVLYVVQDLVRGRTRGWSGWAWVPATALFGPLGLVAYLLFHGRPARAPQRGLSPWRQALGASMVSVAGYAIGWVLAIYLFVYVIGSPGPAVILAISYGLPLAIGLLLMRAPLLASRQGGHYGLAVYHGALAEVISWNLAFAGMFPTAVFLLDRWFPQTVEMGSPMFLITIALMAMAGLVMVYLYDVWAARRGFAGWPGRWTAEATAAGSHTVTVPTMGQAWWVLLLSIALLVASLVPLITGLIGG
jgi:CubicO group peptidase (beta-lactamase class C family)